MARLFGTDGVRGIANEELSCELAFKIGQAGAKVLTHGTHTPRILIGDDARISAGMLASALQAGICSVGAQAEYLGTVPTPGVAYLTGASGADAGVMISASHNSFEYNGIKWFNKEGCKLSDAVEDEIEAIVRGERGMQVPTGAGIGRVMGNEELVALYADYLISSGDNLRDLRVALDCANGAASATASAVFRSLGAGVQAYFQTPNGININADCGSTKPAALQQIVKDTGVDVGLAFDGDADRLIAVDETGALVDGDRIMAIVATDLMERGELAQDTVVVTVMSNLGMKQTLKRRGIATVETAVGDRYVLECMQKEGYNFGGEQSGHMIFLDRATTGDGVLSGIMLLGVLASTGKKLSELAAEIDIYPQTLINIQVANDKKQAAMDDGAVQDRIAEAEAKMAGSGRVLVRASGTEPLLRVMLEGADTALIEKEAAAIAQLIADRFDGRIR